MSKNELSEDNGGHLVGCPVEPVVRGYVSRLELQTTNRPVDVIKHWRDEGFLDMETPYQRGDVWGPIRQRNLIRSILSGIPIPSLIVNVRDWDDDYSIAVIDGKQRMTAVLNFVDSQLDVPGEWFGLGASHDVFFRHLDKPKQSRFRHQTMGFSEGTLPDIDSEREVFELVNFGGVPQGQSDL